MNPETPSPIVSSASLLLPVHEFKFEGRSYRLYKRKPGKDEHWYFRLQANGQRRPRSMETNVAENAVTKAKAMIAASKGEKWETFLDTTALRKTCVITLGKIFEHYRAYPNRKPAQSTRELNIHAITDLVASKHPTAELMPINELTADLVWDWKQKVLTEANAPENTEPRQRQLLRSANSRLTQARSLFAKEVRSYYHRQGKLTLPKCIDEFMKEPKFPTRETGKTDYWPPSDNIIAATFANLAKLLDPADTPGAQEQNLNLYKAIWLSLGFGLRKAEISAAKVNWFVTLNDVLYCAGDVLGKNKKFPRVRAQLGVWDKLQPHLAGKKPDDYVLDGNDEERLDHVFRRCSDWMEGLGWRTQKKIHELRAYAGCQIALGDRTRSADLRAAQEFLRHAQITTTENSYMRYLRTELKEVHLQIPTPQPFIPKIVAS